MAKRIKFWPVNMPSSRLRCSESKQGAHPYLMLLPEFLHSAFLQLPLCRMYLLIKCSLLFCSIIQFDKIRFLNPSSLPCIPANRSLFCNTAYEQVKRLTTGMRAYRNHQATDSISVSNFLSSLTLRLYT